MGHYSWVLAASKCLGILKYPIPPHTTSCRYIRNRLFSKMDKWFRIYRHAGHYSGITACRTIWNFQGNHAEVSETLKISWYEKHTDYVIYTFLISNCTGWLLGAYSPFLRVKNEVKMVPRVKMYTDYIPFSPGFTCTCWQGIAKTFSGRTDRRTFLGSSWTKSPENGWKPKIWAILGSFFPILGWKLGFII